VRRVRLVGVPFNSSGLTDGVARAPEALRRAGLVERLTAAGIEVIDDGDAQLGPTSPERDSSSHLIAPAALGQMVGVVRSSVDRIDSDGDFPLLIGGDCPILLGCLGPGGVASTVGLLFVDGHEDAWPPAASTTGEAADMELGFALGLTTGGLSASLRNTFPIVDPGKVIVLGARDRQELAEAGVASIEDKVTLVPAHALRERGPENVAAEAVNQLNQSGGWWLHVDLDVLATESLAAVDYRQPGGFDWAVLTQITRHALTSGNVRGCTIAIYNPDLDPAADGADRIVTYLVASLGR
jgi:arginase